MKPSKCTCGVTPVARCSFLHHFSKSLRGSSQLCALTSITLHMFFVFHICHSTGKQAFQTEWGSVFQTKSTMGMFSFWEFRAQTSLCDRDSLDSWTFWMAATSWYNLCFVTLPSRIPFKIDQDNQGGVFPRPGQCFYILWVCKGKIWRRKSETCIITLEFRLESGRGWMIKMLKMYTFVLKGCDMVNISGLTSQATPFCLSSSRDCDVETMKISKLKAEWQSR